MQRNMRKGSHLHVKLTDITIGLEGDWRQESLDYMIRMHEVQIAPVFFFVKWQWVKKRANQFLVLQMSQRLILKQYSKSQKWGVILHTSVGNTYIISVTVFQMY